MTKHKQQRQIYRALCKARSTNNESVKKTKITFYFSKNKITRKELKIVMFCITLCIQQCTWILNWESNSLIFIHVLITSKPLYLWKLCNTYYLLKSTCLDTVNIEHHHHLSRMTVIHILSQEHVSTEIWMKYLASWLGGRIPLCLWDPSLNQQARYFIQISAWTLVLVLSHSFHNIQAHLVRYGFKV